jgi:hypothetical protein
MLDPLQAVVERLGDRLRCQHTGGQVVRRDRMKSLVPVRVVRRVGTSCFLEVADQGLRLSPERRIACHP